MKLIVLSDLNWDRNLKKLTEKDFISFSEKNIDEEKFKGINKYYSIIRNEKPEVVLFAGDITGDGSCGHGYNIAFKIILSLLYINGIKTYFISGDHDEIEYYEDVKKFSFCKNDVEDISNKIIEAGNFKILGLPYEWSSNKTNIKNFIKAYRQEKTNILVAHCELKRRPWLFDLNTEIVVTGHFDRKIVGVEDKVFISLDNDFNQISYAVIELNENRQNTISYAIKLKSGETIKLTEGQNTILEGNRNNLLTINGEITKDIRTFESLTNERMHPFSNVFRPNDQIDYIENYGNHSSLKYLRGNNFREGIIILRNLKRNIDDLNQETYDKLKIQIGQNHNISKTMIEDYIGRNKI